MSIDDTARAADLRAEIRDWLQVNLLGDFSDLVGAGGPGREHERIDERLAWERRLGEGRWIGLGWPTAVGGRALPWELQVVFHEEYARVGGPGRVGHIGEQLLGPALLVFGTAEQQARYLPGIVSGTELWCQGYSEPDAGSDLASLRTRAVQRDGEWRVSGQKVWTSLAQHADWCFVMARTDPSSERHRGLSYLLVPMHQHGVLVRPIVQMTGTAEFNEVFFDDARADGMVGQPGDGWKIAMGTLGAERGASTVGQQMAFGRELDAIIETARRDGRLDDPDLLTRLVDAWLGLEQLAAVARWSIGVPDPTGGYASIAKLLWASWHRDLGELAMDVRGSAALRTGEDYDLDDAQRLFLFSRSDTIYGGSNEIQRNVIAERLLGLPKG